LQNVKAEEECIMLIGAGITTPLFIIMVHPKLKNTADCITYVFTKIRYVQKLSLALIVLK